MQTDEGKKINKNSGLIIKHAGKRERFGKCEPIGTFFTKHVERAFDGLTTRKITQEI